MYLSSKIVKRLKPIIFISFLIPSVLWFYQFINNNLGVNPIDKLMDKLGEFTLQLLIFTLIVSDLSKLKSLRSLQLLRRMIGLFAFYYVAIHLLTYVFLDHFFNFSFIIKDIIKRPFITFGFFGFLLLLPLVFTSTKKMLQKLTFKIWKRIHYLIYVVILLGILHFYLLTKADKTEPLIYLFIVFVLFSLRIVRKFINPQVDQF
tara:strand:+ start:4359 stop:4970 length:612 start_codon:yes stop_codon:yes gene_type:complete